jgi:hypothetical protein
MVQPPAWRQEHLHLQHRLVGHRLPLPINFAQLPLQNSRSVKIVPQTQKWIRNPSKLQTLGVMLRQAWLEKAWPRKIQQKEIERLSLPSSNPAEDTQFPQHKGQPTPEQPRRDFRWIQERVKSGVGIWFAPSWELGVAAPSRPCWVCWCLLLFIVLN